MFEKNLGQHLDVRERRGREDEENCIMRSFILVLLQNIVSVMKSRRLR
jgi:hypothetical protein